MGRTDAWIKVKNPIAPAVRREAETDWANSGPGGTSGPLTDRCKRP
jgi:hypothetical protein